MKLTKRKTKEILGIRTDAALSAHFGLCRAACYLWRDDESIPAEHVLTLLRERPELIPDVLSKPASEIA